MRNVIVVAVLSICISYAIKTGEAETEAIAGLAKMDEEYNAAVISGAPLDRFDRIPRYSKD